METVFFYMYSYIILHTSIVDKEQTFPFDGFTRSQIFQLELDYMSKLNKNARIISPS